MSTNIVRIAEGNADKPWSAIVATRVADDDIIWVLSMVVVVVGASVGELLVNPLEEWGKGSSIKVLVVEAVVEVPVVGAVVDWAVLVGTVVGVLLGDHVSPTVVGPAVGAVVGAVVGS